MQSNKIAIGKTNQAILNGAEDLSLWSDEELLRGQRKAKNGRWTGRPPKVVPLRVHEELTRRRLSTAYELLREDLVSAVQVLGEVVRDAHAPTKDRLRAAELIIERVMGKAPVKVEVGQRSVFEEVLEAVVVNRSDVLDVAGWEDQGE